MRTIAIANYSVHVSPADLSAAVAALSVQLNEHIPALGWSVPSASLSIAPAGQQPKGETLYLVNTGNVPGDLAYHTLSNQDVPYGVIYVDLAIKYGVPWQIPFSHEGAEELVNPFCSKGVIVPWARLGSVFLPDEIGDPVQGYSYPINGVPMSDVISPYWQQPGVSGARYDWMNQIQQPLTLGRGGYVSFFDLQSWHQTLGETVPGAQQELHLSFGGQLGRRARLLAQKVWVPR